MIVIASVATGTQRVQVLAKLSCSTGVVSAILGTTDMDQVDSVVERIMLAAWCGS
jgi:hypothetical protein